MKAGLSPQGQRRGNKDEHGSKVWTHPRELGSRRSQVEEAQTHVPRGDSRKKPIHLQNLRKTQMPKKAEVRDRVGGKRGLQACVVNTRHSLSYMDLSKQTTAWPLSPLETCLSSGEKAQKTPDL